jgi:hypothetical protein
MKISMSCLKDLRMKITLRSITILIAALVLIQCSEEEIQLTKKELTADISSAKSSSNSSNAFTIGAMPMHDWDGENPGYDYSFYMIGTGSITINWGDGTSTTHQFTDSWNYFLHGYSTPDNRTITITGDLGNITYFESFYGTGAFNAIDFKRLTNLKDVQIGLTESSRRLDFSHNSKLQSIFLAGMQDLDGLRLPKQHDIRSISLDGPFNFDTNDVDRIIDNIHHNAFAKNLTGGYFTLPATWYHDEGDTSMIGPPSPAAIEKLRALQNTLGWTIYPALDGITTL